jgi:ADP-heptose:LPS heptosyltransferase
MPHKLKYFIKSTAYFCIRFLVSPNKEIKQNSILLIRLDAIGDYILFRNYIEILKNSLVYKDYKVTLLGNEAWKSLALEFDGGFIYKFIWLDRVKFSKNIFYRYKKLQEITNQGYEVILSPVYSRDFFYADDIIRHTSAKEKIGSTGNLSNIQKWQKNISDKYYTRLIKANNRLMFEFDRNKEFFENLLNTTLSINKPSIVLKPKKLKFELPKKYAVLFIGSSNDFRKWNVKNFAEIGVYLKNNYDYDVVLCGGIGDSKESINFAKCFKDKYVDLVGKTSLVDFLYVVNGSGLIISNDTSAAHCAVALQIKKIFVVSNGNHYGRFSPYPVQMYKNYYLILHPDIEKNISNYKGFSGDYEMNGNLDINDIKIEDVINKLDKILL